MCTKLVILFTVLASISLVNCSSEELTSSAVPGPRSVATESLVHETMSVMTTPSGEPEEPKAEEDRELASPTVASDDGEAPHVSSSTQEPPSQSTPIASTPTPVLPAPATVAARISQEPEERKGEEDRELVSSTVVSDDGEAPPVSSSTQEPPSQSTPIASTPTPNLNVSMPEPIRGWIQDANYNPSGFTSLEYRIFKSDAIVHAKLLNVEASASRCPWHDWWKPIVEYQFEVNEYLKGDGEDRISIKTSFGGGGSIGMVVYDQYRTRDDAELVAEMAIAERDQYRSLDSLEAILFLKREDEWEWECNETEPSKYELYTFTLSGWWFAPEYRIYSMYNRAWLPSLDQNESASKSTEAETGDDESSMHFRLSIDSDLSTERDSDMDRFGTISLL